MNMVFNRCRLSASVGRAAGSTVLCVRVCQGRDPPYEAKSWFLHGMSGSVTAASTGANSSGAFRFACVSPRVSFARLGRGANWAPHSSPVHNGNVLRFHFASVSRTAAAILLVTMIGLFSRASMNSNSC